MTARVIDPVPTITTERLILRGSRADDAEGLLPIYSAGPHQRFGSRYAFSRPEQMRAKLERDLAGWKRGESVLYSVTTHHDDTAFGYVGLFHWDQDHRCAELGYALTHEHWGKGYTRELIPPLVRFGFEVMQLHRIEAHVDPRNVASVRLLEGAGFVREGVQRERTLQADGTWADLAIYGLLDRELLRR